MMKIAVIGATGQIGRRSCSIALEKQYQVTALVRDPSRFPADLAAHVKLVRGDVGDSAVLHKVVEGQDAIVSCLGSGTGNENPHALSEGFALLMEAMNHHSVKKISVCLSTFLLWDQSKVPPFAKQVNEEHKLMWTSLKQSNSVTWTAVLPPGFTDEPRSGGKYLVKHEKLIGRRLSKDDLAEFMIECLTMPEHENQSCTIANSTEYLDAEMAQTS